MVKTVAIAIWVVSVFIICANVCADMKREVAKLYAARALTHAIYSGTLGGRTLISVLKNEGAEYLCALGLYEVYFGADAAVLPYTKERLEKSRIALGKRDADYLKEYLAAYGALTDGRQIDEAKKAYTYFDMRYTEASGVCEKNVKVVRTVSATAAFAFTVLLI